LGAPAARGPLTRLVVHPGAPQIVEMQWVSPPDTAPDSAAKRRADMIEGLGLAVLNRRLARIVRSDNPPVLGASSYHGDEFHSAEVTTVQAVAKAGDWKSALATAEQEA